MTKTNPEKKKAAPEDSKPAEQEKSAILDEADKKKSAENEGNGQVDAVAEKVAPDAELTALKTENASLKNDLLRSQAETQNVRKRLQSEANNKYELGKAQILEDMITILDDLERALEVKTDNSQALLDGVSMTLGQLSNVLSKQGLIALDPQAGEKFDPHLHHAIHKEETSELEPNIVIRKVMKGYKLQTRVIRPANVVVSINVQQEATDTTDTKEKK